MSSSRDAHELLARCEDARKAGSDFPTIWRTILSKHPLVSELPRNEVRDDEVIILVRLLNRRSLLSSLNRFWLE